MQRLFQEDEENGEDETDEGDEMVPLERLSLEYEEDEEAENGQRDHLLDNLELEKVERSPVSGEADAVRRDGQAVLEKGDPPGEEDDQDQRPAR